ncbi:MAG: DUF2085 domain-containing protein [Lachnospiraceae bacterium]
MSRLRQTVLEAIRTFGNKSGCHQLPDRSFFYKGKQFPVCARCTGVFIGQVAAISVSFFHAVSAALSGVLIAIMGIDWTVQYLSIKTSNNWRRLLTGFCGGFGLFTLYTTAVKYLFRYVKNKL